MHLNKGKISDYLLVVLIITVFLGSTDMFPVIYKNIFKALTYLTAFSFIGLNFNINNLKNKFQLTILVIYIWYLLFYFASGIMSPDKIHGILIFLNTGLLAVLFIFSSRSYFLKHGQNIFFKCIFYSAFSLVFISFLLSVSGYEITYYGDEDVNLDAASSVFGYKFTGVYKNPNIFGTLLGLTIILSVYLITSVKNLINKKVLIFAIILSSITLLLTASRGSILFALSSVFTYFGILRDKRVFYVVVFSSLIGLIVFNYFDADSILQRFEEASLSGRDVIWEDALKKARGNLIFGIGPNQYSFFSTERMTEISAHNYYLNNLVNIGLPAIFLYVIGLFSIWTYGLIIFNKTNKIKTGITKQIAICISLPFGLALNQLFESTAFNPGHFAGFTVYFLLGMILSLPNNSTIKKKMKMKNSKSFKSQIKTFKDSDNILIYQMGKVGSTTLLESIPNSMHFHTLYDRKYCQFYQDVAVQNGYKKLKSNFINKIKVLYFQKRKKIKIITLVRNPFERDVSHYFQDLQFWLIKFKRI